MVILEGTEVSQVADDGVVSNSVDKYNLVMNFFEKILSIAFNRENLLNSLSTALCKMPPSRTCLGELSEKWYQQAESRALRHALLT